MLRLRLLTGPLPRCWCGPASVDARLALLFQPFLEHRFTGSERELSFLSGSENDLDDDVSQCVLSGVPQFTGNPLDPDGQTALTRWVS